MLAAVPTSKGQVFKDRVRRVIVQEVGARQRAAQKTERGRRRNVAAKHAIVADQVQIRLATVFRFASTGRSDPPQAGHGHTGP
jgi:hypothetical protein